MSRFYEMTYEEALYKQNQLNSEGGFGWFLFECPPTITLGTRGHFSDVLMPMDELKRLGVTLLPVSRGGQVTYHGPGQIVAFPYGKLESHVGDSRGVKKFIGNLERSLQGWIQEKLTPESGRVVKTEQGNAGLWVWDESAIRKKIVSIGMSFHRSGISHGFSLNVLPVSQGFELVNACGEIGAKVTSILNSDQSLDEVKLIRSELLSLLQGLHHQRS